jgi:RHH-type proline utilization regulon transcriptional repressor/proline dehydrogenase/delta 1-pyrroline-5-carboxylate dehydrogenase
VFGVLGVLGVPWGRKKGRLKSLSSAAESPVGAWTALPGPTGEANLYTVLPREDVLCLAPEGANGDADRLHQLAAVLAVGAQAIWPASARTLAERLPLDVQEHISLAADWQQGSVHFDAVLHHGDATSLLATLAAVAARPGPIVPVHGAPSGERRVPLERLVVERSLSINTAAAGGNASLMAIG